MEPSSAARTDTDATQSPPSGFRFAAATLFVVGATATFAPFLAAAMFGLSVTWDGQRSTGGIVAVVASIAMWIWCRSWEAWRRWVWLPVIATVIISFLVVSSWAVVDADSASGEASTPSWSPPPSTPRPPSQAQLDCEAQGFTWDVALKCVTTRGQELRSQGWGSIEGVGDGRVYYSFGDPQPCGDRMCQAMIFHADELTSCPRGVSITPYPGSEGAEGATTAPLTPDTQVQVPLLVPHGAENAYFAYSIRCG